MKSQTGYPAYSLLFKITWPQRLSSHLLQVHFALGASSQGYQKKTREMSRGQGPIGSTGASAEEGETPAPHSKKHPLNTVSTSVTTQVQV